MNKIFFLLLLGFYQLSFSQENEMHERSEEISHDATSHLNHFKKHSLGLVLSHTHINSGVKDGSGNSLVALASFAINYNYNFNKKWSLGLHNDIIIEEFVVSSSGSGHSNKSELKKDESEQTIDRDKPVSSAIMATYRPLEHLALLAGAGMEFSKHEDFAVVRLGVEVPFHIPNNWEIFGSVLIDVNINAYNSLSFGFGIAKLF